MNSTADLPTAVLDRPVRRGPDEFQMTRISIRKIRVDGGSQMRAGLDEQTVREYATLMGDDVQFPPCVVYWDGESYWMADGFHRLAAWRACYADVGIGPPGLNCEVRHGTLRDAILHAAQANAAHGLRRNNEDKRRAVETLLRDEEWGQWSDREIARRCAVDHKFVGKLRHGLTGDIPSEKRTYVTRHGTEATMNTTNIGRSQETSAAVPQTEEGSKWRLPNNGLVAKLPDGSWIVRRLGYYLATDAYETREAAVDAWNAGDTSEELGRHWSMVLNLHHTPPEDGNFRYALEKATADQIELALVNLPAEGNKVRINRLEAALRRLQKEEPSYETTTEGGYPGEPEDWPDGNVPDSWEPSPAEDMEARDRQNRLRELWAVYSDALDALPDVAELTGLHVDTLPVRRGLKQLLRNIEGCFVPQSEDNYAKGLRLKTYSALEA